MSASAESPAAGLYCPTCERTFAAGTVCPDDATRLVTLATTDAMLGQVLDGRYTLVSKLGDGGMGAVYRATQHSVGREVAIKLMAPNLVSDPMAIKRFLREAKLASRLSHPNAVAVLDFGQTQEGMFFLVMELVEGRSLEKALDEEPVMTVARVIRIGTQICDALEGAHALQIVHRDLKPGNVMLLAGKRDLVKVLDFGIAKSLASSVDTKMTHTGSTVGTPAFMPPEIAVGATVDIRADLYSLGCMLYLMSTGNLPFVAASVPELMVMHRDLAPTPMYGVPEPLAAIVMCLLEKQPSRRFASAGATREALEAATETIRASRQSSPALVTGEAKTAMVGVPAEASGAAERYETPPAMSAIVSTPQHAVTPVPMAAHADLAPAPPRSRGLVIALAAIAAIGVSIGVFALVRRSVGTERVDNTETAASPPATPPLPAASAPTPSAPVPSAPIPTVPTPTAPSSASDAGVPDAAVIESTHPTAAPHHHHDDHNTTGSGSGSGSDETPF